MFHSSQNNMKALEGVAELAGECLRMEIDSRPENVFGCLKTQVEVKQTGTFPWGWSNKPAAQNNC
jgi:hypothetical protein